MTINTIVKKLIPRWTSGLCVVQLDLISAILDGEDILCCTATGDGKLAAFSVPTLVLLEYNKYPEMYPAGLPTWTRPVGVIITPMKGLADNTVCFPCLKTKMIIIIFNGKLIDFMMDVLSNEVCCPCE